MVPDLVPEDDRVILKDRADLKECDNLFHRGRGVNEDPVDRAIPENHLPELVPLFALNNGLHIFWLN